MAKAKKPTVAQPTAAPASGTTAPATPRRCLVPWAVAMAMSIAFMVVLGIAIYQAGKAQGLEAELVAKTATASATTTKEPAAPTTTATPTVKSAPKKRATTMRVAPGHTEPTTTTTPPTTPAPRPTPPAKKSGRDIPGSVNAIAIGDGAIACAFVLQMGGIPTDNALNFSNRQEIERLSILLKEAQKTARNAQLAYGKNSYTANCAQKQVEEIIQAMAEVKAEPGI